VVIELWIGDVNGIVIDGVVCEVVIVFAIDESICTFC
jgi:hypothetical protein